MDDELQQFEAELKQLRPVTPSRELKLRIEAELTASAGESAENPRPFWWAWIALPAVMATAAALALVVFMSSPVSAPPTGAPAVAVSPGGPAFKPVSAENVLLEAKDEGLVTLADGSAARRVRQSYIDTIVWKDPAGRASLRWSVPRQEERVVPVVFQ
ncbi:MAG: hypothetical protein JSS11_04935 [Verrucomicrobia bacterium]|nr:hypothetical protein [Verrucomicrobiota bacterium]